MSAKSAPRLEDWEKLDGDRYKGCVWAAGFDDGTLITTGGVRADRPHQGVLGQRVRARRRRGGPARRARAAAAHTRTRAVSARRDSERAAGRAVRRRRRRDRAVEEARDRSGGQRHDDVDAYWDGKGLGDVLGGGAGGG